MNVSIIHVKGEYSVLNESFCELFLLLRHVVPLNDGTLRLTMPIKGRWARDALIHTFDISDFKCNTNNSTETKHIHHESANLIESYDVVWTPWFGRISILNEGSKVWSHTFAFVTHVITWRRKYVACYGKSMSSPA